MKQIKDKSIEDTGERMIPAYHKQHLVYGEHIVRYQAAENLVKGKVILDIASGSGYGSALLGQSAKKVYGVDVDQDAIEYATKNYATSNVSFLLGNGKQIPLEDNSVDVVVSFETIEHIEDYRYFIKEVNRVLKKEGLFILSTPNDVEFPEGAHFHIHEFEHKELKDLVSKDFKNIKEYFQVTWLYNALLEEKLISEEVSFAINTMNTAPVNSDKAIYFYMLCSNREISESIEPLAAISEHWSERQVLEHNAEMDKYIKKTIIHFEGILLKKDEEIASLNKKGEELRVQIDNLQKSFVQKAKGKIHPKRNKDISK